VPIKDPTHSIREKKTICRKGGRWHQTTNPIHKMKPTLPNMDLKAKATGKKEKGGESWGGKSSKHKVSEQKIISRR